MSSTYASFAKQDVHATCFRFFLLTKSQKKGAKGIADLLLPQTAQLWEAGAIVDQSNKSTSQWVAFVVVVQTTTLQTGAARDGVGVKVFRQCLLIPLLGAASSGNQMQPDSHHVAIVWRR